MQLKTVKIDKTDDTNFILGQTHFIKSVEDIHEAWVLSCPPLVLTPPECGAPDRQPCDTGSCPAGHFVPARRISYRA